MTLRAGDAAPEFALRDQHGRRTTLEGLRGRPALLVFFPFAFSGVCTGELRALHEDRERWAGVALLAISCDPVFTLRAFADRDGLDLPLLSDFWPHGAVCREYGVLDEDHGCPTRSTYLLDGAGVVRWSVHNPMGEARRLDEYARAIAALETRR